MKGPATELIHAGEVDRLTAVPLTTPIYETTTFVFDNAQEVRRLQRRAIVEAPLLALYEPDGRQRRSRSWRRIDRAEAALLFSSGMGATTTILMAHVKAGDEIVCGAAIYGGTLHLLQDVLAHFGVTPRFVSLEELAALEPRDRRSHADGVVRVANQPDAALRRCPPRSRKRAGRAACCRSSTTRSPAR